MQNKLQFQAPALTRTLSNQALAHHFLRCSTRGRGGGCFRWLHSLEALFLFALAALGQALMPLVRSGYVYVRHCIVVSTVHPIHRRKRNYSLRRWAVYCNGERIYRAVWTPVKTRPAALRSEQHLSRYRTSRLAVVLIQIGSPPRLEVAPATRPLQGSKPAVRPSRQNVLQANIHDG